MIKVCFQNAVDVNKSGLVELVALRWWDPMDIVSGGFGNSAG
jgi:hypothetical protein